MALVGDRNIYRRADPDLLSFGALLVEHYRPSFAFRLYIEVLLYRDDTLAERRGLCDAYVRLLFGCELSDRSMEWYHYVQRVPSIQVFHDSVYDGVSMWPPISVCPGLRLAWMTMFSGSALV